MDKIFDVVIVGAGLGGVILARQLQSQNVLLIDKAKSPGGRAATRRVGGVPVNHGLDQFQAHHPLLKELTSFGFHEDFFTRDGDVYKSIAAINNWVKLLAQDLKLENLKTVSSIEEHEGIYRILDNESKIIAQSVKVVLATPAPQAHEILKRSNLASDFLKEVEYSSLICHYVMLKQKFEHRDLILLKEAQAGFLYSYKFSERLPDTLKVMPREELNLHYLKLFSIPNDIIIDSYTHRWLYSQVKKSIPEKYQFSFADQNLFLLGDYFSLNGVEGVIKAVLSLEKSLS